MMRPPPTPPSPCFSPPFATSPHLLLYSSPAAPAAPRSVSVSTTVVKAAASSGSAIPRRRLILLRHGGSAVGERFPRDHDRPLSEAGRADAISVSDKFRQMGWAPKLIVCSYQMKNLRWRPVFALETGGSPNSDGEDFEEDSGFLGRTRLGRLVQAAGRQLLEKLNSARSNSPHKDIPRAP